MKEYKRTNVYETADEKTMKAIFDYAEGYKKFLGECKTEREACAYIVEEAEKKGYKQFDFSEKVKKGDKLCGTRVIPLVIAKERMEQAKLLAGDEPIMRLVPVRPRKYGLVTTGNEVFYGRIEDTFSPVVQAKLAEFGCEMAAHVILNDDHERITAAINDRPGGLAAVLKLFAAHDIQIEYMYAFIAKSENEAYVVMRIENEDEAVKLLKENGFTGMND